METKWIAIVCFIGSVLGCAVALYCTPDFWLLGVLAGGASGYLLYDVGEVFRAIPKALRAVLNEFQEVVSKFVWVWSWLREPHPFLLLAMTLSAPLTYLCTLVWPHPKNDMLIFVISCSALYVSFVCATVSILFMLALEGANLNYEFWSEGKQLETIIKLLGDKNVRRPLTVRNVLRWTWRGLPYVVMKVAEPVVGVVAFVFFFLPAGMVWYTIVQVHSQKRVLCAVDSALGVAISYLLLASTAQTVEAQVTLVLFGGVIGAALGALSHEVISKRIGQLDQYFRGITT